MRFILFKITGWLSVLCTNDIFFKFIISMVSDSMSMLFAPKSDLSLNVRELRMPLGSK